MLTIGDIEDLFIERIQARLPYLATVETYKNQINWENVVSGKDVPLVAVRLPGVLLALAGMKAEGGSYEGQDITLTFSLAVVCKNLRGEEAARRDPEGAYQILGDLWQALAREVLHEDLLPVAFVSQDLAWASNEFVMYVAQYAVTGEFEYKSLA